MLQTSFSKLNWKTASSNFGFTADDVADTMFDSRVSIKNTHTFSRRRTMWFQKQLVQSNDISYWTGRLESYVNIYRNDKSVRPILFNPHSKIHITNPKWMTISFHRPTRRIIAVIRLSMICRIHGPLRANTPEINWFENASNDGTNRAVISVSVCAFCIDPRTLALRISSSFNLTAHSFRSQSIRKCNKCDLVFNQMEYSQHPHRHRLSGAIKELTIYRKGFMELLHALKSGKVINNSLAIETYFNWHYLRIAEKRIFKMYRNRIQELQLHFVFAVNHIARTSPFCCIRRSQRVYCRYFHSLNGSHWSHSRSIRKK